MLNLTTINEPDWFDQEPSFSELDAIEAEWPAIEAELSLLEDELHQLFPECLGDFDIDVALGDEVKFAFPTFSMS
ncbi:DUF6284 family protein [Glycomyces sp. TRM65418]|uniref:DUF6284 family protein n=1 Tax=Glycomyces sp. TRM65418 TaxID=2867006 RepID=UPI001CE52184|nr:DUF6284 family protein [Glycomyces sp. TRM65418]MCC3762455.1 DUF6284 family protein [Glycomyces sp. TRM65418]QZD56499.1 hypothetical protein K3N28_05110 [Glycomyces sp. TRM65418]